MLSHHPVALVRQASIWRAWEETLLQLFVYSTEEGSVLYRSQKDGAELGASSQPSKHVPSAQQALTISPAQQKPKDQADLFTEIAEHFFC